MLFKKYRDPYSIGDKTKPSIKNTFVFLIQTIFLACDLKAVVVLYSTASQVLSAEIGEDVVQIDVTENIPNSNRILLLKKQSWCLILKVYSINKVFCSGILSYNSFLSFTVILAFNEYYKKYIISSTKRNT